MMLAPPGTRVQVQRVTRSDPCERSSLLVDLLVRKDALERGADTGWWLPREPLLLARGRWWAGMGSGKERCALRTIMTLNSNRLLWSKSASATFLSRSWNHDRMKSTGLFDLAGGAGGG